VRKPLTPQRVAHLQRLQQASKTGMVCDECERELPVPEGNADLAPDDEAWFLATKVAGHDWVIVTCGRCVRREQEEADADG